MADEEKVGTSSRGADWEVVALTASSYAAAPRPDADPTADSRDRECEQEHDSSNALFMSQHFVFPSVVFPPSEHENLPLEADSGETHDQTEDHGILYAEEEDNYLDEFNEDNSEAEFFLQSMEPQEARTQFFSGHPSDDENDISETYDFSEKQYERPPDFAKLGTTGDGNGGSGLPGEAWWKRHVMRLYKQAKETNTFWSIFIASAFMGFVVLGQQWRRERLQLQQLKWQFSNTNEVE